MIEAMKVIINPNITNQQAAKSLREIADMLAPRDLTCKEMIEVCKEWHLGLSEVMSFKVLADYAGIQYRGLSSAEGEDF